MEHKEDEMNGKAIGYRLRLVVGLCLLLSGCAVMDLSSLMHQELEETTVQSDPHWFVLNKILLVDISGEIMDTDSGGLFSDLACTPDYVKAVLNIAKEDENVRAVVLRIDSPGGTVSASELIAREIKLFRKRTGVSVIAQINSMGCSGAYYIACAADRIQAQPSAIIGSIGVIAILPKLRKLADKIGYDQLVFKSGAMKDIGNSMRDMTDEERAVFQKLIDSDYSQFLDWILVNRSKDLTREKLTLAADGRIFTTQDALDRKLIDSIGYLDDALILALDSAKIKHADVVTYSYSQSEDMNIYSPRGAVRPLRVGSLNLPAGLTEKKAGFYYLWMPGR
jgi:protease-4